MTAPSFVKKTVKDCLRIKKDDRVLIFTWRHTLDLAEALAIECMKTGADTHVELQSDEIFFETLTSLSIDDLKRTDPFGLALLDVSTANIFISGPEDPTRMRGIPAEKWNAMFRSEKPFYDKMLQRKVRSVEIMIGLVTPQRAKTYGFIYKDWKENMQAALDVQYHEMRKLAMKLEKVLTRAREVRIATSNGTDLKLNLEERPILIYDGVIDEEDLSEGAYFAALPSGNVSVAPKETSGDGSFVSDAPEPSQGMLFRDVTWKFKDGKLVSFEGGGDTDILKQTWAKSVGDKDRIASLTFGINPNARTGFTFNPIVLGTVTIGVGDNRELGGKNESDYGLRFTATKPTVEFDGKIVIKQGRITL